MSGDPLFRVGVDATVLLIVLIKVVVAFAGAVSWLILKAIDLTIGLRVPEQEEVLGLDTTQHGELAYQR